MSYLATDTWGKTSLNSLQRRKDKDKTLLSATSRLYIDSREEGGDWGGESLGYGVLSLQQKGTSCIADRGIGRGDALAGLGILEELQVHLQPVAILT